MHSMQEQLKALGHDVDEADGVESFNPCQMTVADVRELVANSDAPHSDVIRELAKATLLSVVGLADTVEVTLSRETVVALGGAVKKHRNRHCLDKKPAASALKIADIVDDHDDKDSSDETGDEQ